MTIYHHYSRAQWWKAWLRRVRQFFSIRHHLCEHGMHDWEKYNRCPHCFRTDPIDG